MSADLDKVYAKFWEITQEIVQPWKTDKSLVVASPTQDMDVDPKEILLSAHFRPSTVTPLEKGGPEALSVQDGIWLVTLSRPKKISESKTLRIAQAIQRAFRRQEFPVPPDGCRLYCDEPEPRDAGEDPGTKRRLSTISVPWWVWVIDEGEE